MKKFLGVLLGFGLLYGASFASNNDCQTLEFDDATICVSIQQDGNNTYSVDVEDINASDSFALSCEIMPPNNILQPVGPCVGTFHYNGNGTTLILRATVNNEVRSFIGRYDFDNEEWISDLEPNDGSSSHHHNNNNNGDLDNYAVTTDDTSPSTSQRVDLTVKARDDSNHTITDFDGSFDYKVYYRSSSSSSWTQTTSSTYYEVDSDYRNGYDFTSSDDGVADLSNFIKFKKNNYDYKLRIIDQDDSSIYKEITFNVGSSSNSNNSNGDLDEFDIRLSPTTPESDEWTTVTVKAVDSQGDLVNAYYGTVTITFEYKDGSTWRDLSFGSYDTRNIAIDSNDEYDFMSSDHSKIDFDVKFDDEDQYKITIEDNDENVSTEKTFTVDDNGSSNNSSNGDLDNYAVTADDTSPSTSQRVDLTVKARDNSDDVITDFNGSFDYKVYYRSSSSSSWTQTTSSTYYEVDSDYRNGYDFTSSDDGVADLSNFIKFKKNNYDYKLRIIDQDDSSIYKEITFNVGSSSNSNNSNDDFTSSERSQVRAIYNLWPNLIDDLEAKTPSLRHNTSRQNDQEDLYREMRKIVNDDNSIYSDYNEFFDAFMNRYTNTMILSH